jgi:hypothetical protein
MLRHCAVRRGLWSVLREEGGKLLALARHDVTSYADFVTGKDESEKEKKIRAAHAEIAAQAAAREAERRAKLTWSQTAREALQSLRDSTSSNAGVVALVQHCARAHMAEVAVEQNIDVRDVTILTERAAGGAVGQNATVVGYIDAPAATEEEAMAFAAKLQKACPAARTHGSIEWRRGAPPLPGAEPEPKTPFVKASAGVGEPGDIDAAAAAASAPAAAPASAAAGGGRFQPGAWRDRAGRDADLSRRKADVEGFRLYTGLAETSPSTPPPPPPPPPSESDEAAAARVRASGFLGMSGGATAAPQDSTAPPAAAATTAASAPPSSMSGFTSLQQPTNATPPPPPPAPPASSP